MKAYVIEFKGSDNDRWHRWALRESFESALVVLGVLFDVKHVHGVAIREVTTP